MTYRPLLDDYRYLDYLKFTSQGGVWNALRVNVNVEFATPVDKNNKFCSDPYSSSFDGIQFGIYGKSYKLYAKTPNPNPLSTYNIVSSILDEKSGKVYEDEELYSFLVENNF